MKADVSPIAAVDLAQVPDLEIGGAQVRPAVREIGRGADRETLEPRVMRVLVALARRMGQVVSRDELIAACWDGRIVGDDAINVSVAKVRKAGEAFGAFRIETVARVGYRMIPAAAPAPPLGGAPRRALLVAGLVAGGAAVAGALYAVTRPAGAGGSRVAVIPFEALSSDRDAVDFVRAADTQIAGALQDARIQTAEGARNAAFRLEGTARSAGDRLQVRVALVEAGADLAIWSAEFERAKAAAASLPNDIGWRAATVIDIALQARREGGRAMTPEVLALYVKARDETGLAGGGAGLGLDLAVREAPTVALLRGWRAASLAPRATFARDPEFRVTRDMAVAEAREAMRLDPELSIAYAALAQATDGRAWVEREALLRRVGREGEVDAANGYVVIFLSSAGRLDEAARLGRAIAGSHRTWPVVAPAIDRAIYLSGEPDEAMAYLRRDLAVRPDDSLLKAAMLEVSALGGFDAEAQAMLSDPPVGPGGVGPGTLEAFRAFVAARASGSVADRERAVALILREANARRLLRAHAIPMLNRLDALDEAFALAEAYVRDPVPMRMGHSVTTWLFFGPDTALMRRDPRIIPIFRDLGLIDYWRSSGQWPDFCETEPQSVCEQMKQA